MQKINEKVIRVPVEVGRIQVVDDRRADAERTGSDDCENVGGEVWNGSTVNEWNVFFEMRSKVFGILLAHFKQFYLYICQAVNDETWQLNDCQLPVDFE